MNPGVTLPQVLKQRMPKDEVPASRLLSDDSALIDQCQPVAYSGTRVWCRTGPFPAHLAPEAQAVVQRLESGHGHPDHKVEEIVRIVLAGFQFPCQVNPLLVPQCPVNHSILNSVSTQFAHAGSP